MNKYPDLNDENCEQERCCSCGQFGYSYDVGPFHDGTGDKARKLFLCSDCSETIQEDLHRYQGHGENCPDFPADALDSDTLTPEQFNALLWMAAENEGGLFLYGQTPESLGLSAFVGHDGYYLFPVPLTTYPDGSAHIGRPIFKLEQEEHGGKLMFCCCEGEQWENYLQNKLAFDI